MVALSSKNTFRQLLSILIGSLLTSTTNSLAEDTEQDRFQERMARFFSSDLSKIERRLGKIEGKLTQLPKLRATPLAGRYGFRSPTLFAQDHPQWVQIDLGKVSTIDQVIAVPTHIPRLGKDGKGYGFPLRFKISVSNDPQMTDAKTVIDRSGEDFENPGRYPLIFRIDPVKARFVRFTSTRHVPSSEGFGEGYFWALEELMVLSGNTELSSRSGGWRHEAPISSGYLDFFPHWALVRLNDHQSALGTPVNTKKSPTLGYLSASTEISNDEKWVIVDLGKQYSVDEIRLIATESNAPEVIGGRGFPQKMALELSNEPTFSGKIWRQIVGSQKLLGYPGGCPEVVLPLGHHARYLRIRTEALWRHREGRHAFSLAEVQVYSGGENVALGKAVTAKDVTSKLDSKAWAPQYLVDGFSSKFQLIEFPQYFKFIERRNQLEKEQASLILLRDEEVRITSQFFTYGGIALGTTAGLGWLWMLIRQRSVKRRATTKLQNQIARDLHDDIGCNLGSIVLLSDMGSKCSGEERSREDFTTIRETAEETSQSMKDIVWLIRHGNTSLQDLVTHMRRAIEVILDDLDVSVSVTPDKPSSRKVSLFFKRHVYFAFKEALHNIRRHADATKVKVDLTISDQDLSFEISDHGKGFDRHSVANTGNGLLNIEQRAERLKGRCRITSTPGEGTQIFFSSPLKSDLKTK